MIALYRLDYMRDKVEKIEQMKEYVLLFLKNSIWMLWDVFLVKKEYRSDFLENKTYDYKKYDVEIKDLNIETITPAIKMRVSNTLFMIIFSADIIELLVWNKAKINNILW